MTDPAILTGVAIVTVLFVGNVVWSQRLNARVERTLAAAIDRLTRIEDAAHKFALVDVQEPKYSARWQPWLSGVFSLQLC